MPIEALLQQDVSVWLWVLLPWHLFWRSEGQKVNWKLHRRVNSFVHFGNLYSASSRCLLRLPAQPRLKIKDVSSWYKEGRLFRGSKRRDQQRRRLDAVWPKSEPDRVTMSSPLAEERRAWRGGYVRYRATDVEQVGRSTTFEETTRQALLSYKKAKAP